MYYNRFIFFSVLMRLLCTEWLLWVDDRLSVYHLIAVNGNEQVFWNASRFRCCQRQIVRHPKRTPEIIERSLIHSDIRRQRCGISQRVEHEYTS